MTTQSYIDPKKITWMTTEEKNSILQNKSNRDICEKNLTDQWYIIKTRSGRYDLLHKMKYLKTLAFVSSYSGIQSAFLETIICKGDPIK